MSFPNLYENLGFTWAGPWVFGREYFTNQVVQDDQGLYYTALCDNNGIALTDVGTWVPLAQHPRVAPNIVGGPVLYGPYVVDYTDIPHDEDKKTLWTPQVGDVLLRLFTDWQTVVQWDSGTLFIGQNVDGKEFANVIVAAYDATRITRASGFDAFDLSSQVSDSNSADDEDGNPWYSSAYVFHSTDPVQIQLTVGFSESEPNQGHVELYAVVARAVAPQE